MPETIKKSLSANSWFNDLADAAFGKISAIYGQIDKNKSSVRKRVARKMAITDKCSKKRLLSVNHHHNWPKFTGESLGNAGLSVKCFLLTDKSAKNGTLSVNLSEILAEMVEQRHSLKR